MPLRPVYPHEAMYAFVIVSSGLECELLLYSGEWSSENFAGHVYNILRTGELSTLPGSSGQCRNWKGCFGLLQCALGGLSDTHDGIYHSCDVCCRMCSTIQACGKCKFARYCSPECQRVGWRSGHKHACALTFLCFPRVHTRRYDRSFYGYLSGYDFELWLHLIREEVHINVAASKHG